MTLMTKDEFKILIRGKLDCPECHRTKLTKAYVFGQCVGYECSKCGCKILLSNVKVSE